MEGNSNESEQEVSDIGTPSMFRLGGAPTWEHSLAIYFTNKQNYIILLTLSLQSLWRIPYIKGLFATHEFFRILILSINN